MKVYIFRRTQLLRRFPTTGFVIFNPEAVEGLSFYCRTSTTKKARTTYWCEVAIDAKIFDKESQAKAVRAAMKKRNKKDVDKLTIIPIESLMLDAFEIDMNTGEVQECKAWPVEFERKSVFKTKLEAINSEIQHKMKDRASLVLQAQELSKQIENLEAQVKQENRTC